MAEHARLVWKVGPLPPARPTPQSGHWCKPSPPRCPAALTPHPAGPGTRARPAAPPRLPVPVLSCLLRSLRSLVTDTESSPGSQLRGTGVAAPHTGRGPSLSPWSLGAVRCAWALPRAPAPSPARGAWPRVAARPRRGRTPHLGPRPPPPSVLRGPVHLGYRGHVGSGSHSPLVPQALPLTSGAASRCPHRDMGLRSPLGHAHGRVGAPPPGPAAPTLRPHHVLVHVP